MTEYSALGSSPYDAARRRSSLGARPLARSSPVRRLDWVLLGAVLLLLGIGTLLVWSATRERMLAAGLGPQTYLKRHLLNAVIGLALGGLVAEAT